MGVSVVNPDASGAASPAAGKQDSRLEVYPGRASGAYLLRERTMRVRCARIVLPSALAVACGIAARMDWPKLWRKDGGASAGPPTSLVLGATVAAVLCLVRLLLLAGDRAPTPPLDTSAEIEVGDEP